MFAKQITLPSKKISTIDVKEVTNLSVRFQYNYFTKDERTNTLYKVPKYFKTANNSESGLNQVQSVDFNSRVPRFNILTWTPVIIGEKSEITANIEIRKNLESIYYEDDYSYETYSVLEIQDYSPDKKIQLFSETLLNTISNTTASSSGNEIVKQTNAATSITVKPELISLGFKPKNYGISFFNDSMKQLDSNQYNKILTEIKTDFQINNKLIGDLIEYNSNLNLLNPNQNEYAGFLRESRKIQTQAKEAASSTRISSDEYELEIENFITQKPVFASVHSSIVQSVGYLIEKIEYNEDGSQTIHPIIVLESRHKNNFIDTEVKYGTRYSYAIRTVFYVEVEGLEEESGLASALGILVASKQTPSIIVDCLETTPPPPPQDISFKFIANEKALKITWNLPVNPQRDIKKFQVFRRENVYEPFELLKEYDFDDSEVKELTGEFPLLTLVEKLSGPKTIFFDYEFNGKKSYIYSLVSVDAHGISSNYSTQYKIYFDKILNRLQVFVVSASGAPKAYPNIMINQDAFTDSIKSEEFTELEIFFNPEYLKLFNKNDNELNLLALNSNTNNNCYQLQLINLDVNEQQILTIKLNDRTENIIQEPIDSSINRTLIKRKLNAEKQKGLKISEEGQAIGFIDKKINSVFKKQ
jgi:hypothetical protein